MATANYRQAIPSRRLVPFILTNLALQGYLLSAKLEEQDGDEDDTMWIIASLEAA